MLAGEVISVSLSRLEAGAINHDDVTSSRSDRDDATSSSKIGPQKEPLS
jgi:hypothetical protein